MKMLDKEQILSSSILSNIINERKILSELRYPLIVNLRCALQDEHYLYMIVDLMQGGDLKYHMRTGKGFTLQRVRFYLAQIALSISYIHSQGYIHRDIKPDNILLDSEGNCHLTDFNLSDRISEEKELRNFAGTRPYIAPEIYLKEPYGKEVDWWSLGVVVYELIFDELPFVGTKSQMRNLVTREKLSFPDNDTNPELLNLIKGLLRKDKKRRFGFEDIKKHKWMEGVDWEGVEQKTVPTPWTPNRNRANFDGSHDLDEQFLKKKKKRDLTQEEHAKFAEWDWDPNVNGENV